MLKETDEDHFITVKKDAEAHRETGKDGQQVRGLGAAAAGFVAKRIKTIFSVECERRWTCAMAGSVSGQPRAFPRDDEIITVAYDAGEEKIKHYRVDKVRGLRMLEEPREGEEHFRQFDMGDYAGKNFGMFGGREYRVRLLMKNDLAGVVIDRFGKDVSLIPVDEGHLR